MKDLLKARLSPARFLPPCMADAFRESGTTNEATSLGFSRFFPSQCTSSCTGLTRFLGSRLIPLMASGLREVGRMIDRENFSVFSPSRALEHYLAIPIGKQQPARPPLYASDFRQTCPGFTFISDRAMYWSLQPCPSFSKGMTGDAKGLISQSFMTNACDVITYVVRSFHT